MGAFKRLAVGGALSIALLTAGTILTLQDPQARGIPWLACGVAIGVLTIAAFHHDHRTYG